MDLLIATIQNSVIEIDKMIQEVDFFEHESFDDEINEIIKTNLSKLQSIKAIVRKKDKTRVEINPNGRYIITYIDVDGVENTRINWSFGSLFTVYDQDIAKENIVEVIYVVYGPRTELVVTKDEPEVFLLQSDGEFHSKKKIHFKTKGNIVSFGSSIFLYDERYYEIMKSLLGEGYRLRHSDSLIMDINFLFLKGGGILSINPKKIDPIFDLYGFKYIFSKTGIEQIHGQSETERPIILGSKYELDRAREILNLS